MRYFIVFFISFIIMVPAYGASEKRKSFVFKAIEIKGTIQKPEAMYFLSRARFNYQMLDLNVSFINKVEKAIYREDAF